MGDLYLQKSDIILVKGTYLIDKGIELITHSQFSHVAIVSNPEVLEIIEATPTGVIRSSITKYTGHASVLRLKTFTNTQIENIVNFAEQHLGNPYDFGEIVHQYLRYTFQIPDNNVEKNRYICSTLVNVSYLSEKIRLTKQTLPSPEDIYESTLLNKIADI
ncbi:YiiX/YebB-like N1pC/P60 family cysteine hydrolase [Ectobacillus polymachus]|uniref:YiiX/YebB-like N1pC/P60 family cysteine hydrolase n=1 Tax=Ectobacillus polymachus TaxID=1508806 RepID=UPI003A8B8320